jgi:hypothetical protein
MKKFVRMAREYLKLSSSEKKLVAEWIVQKAASECPYLEEESYYSRSSHCKFVDFFRQVREELSPVFRKAEYSADFRGLCAEIEIYFVLMYTYSSVYCAAHHSDREWFHHPWWGLFSTFADFARCEDTSGLLIGYLTAKLLLSNKSVKMVNAVREKYKGRWHEGLEGGPTVEILAVCKEAMDNQLIYVAEILNSLACSDLDF